MSATTQLPPYDPQWLAAEQMVGGRQTLMPELVETSRARFNMIFESLKPILPPPTDAVVATDINVPSTGRRVRIYKPASASPSKPLPVGLYIHSGGWYCGTLENEDYIARNICENSNMIIYSPEYRLAPENPYPAGHSDVYAAYEYMCHSAAEHGGDPTKKFVMGGSAGGNFTASVVLKYARDSQLKAQGAVILCPAAAHPDVLNARFKDRYHPELYKETPMIGSDMVKEAWGWLASPPEDPLASVLLHPDIKLLPPLYISITTQDPTYDETTLFAEKCREAGVSVDVVEWVGWPHFFHVIPMPKSFEFMQVWNDKLKEMIAKT